MPDPSADPSNANAPQTCPRCAGRGVLGDEAATVCGRCKGSGTSPRPPSAATVSVDSDEGMLREAHDILHLAMDLWNDPPMPWQWLAADLMERLTKRFPEAKDVI